MSKEIHEKSVYNCKKKKCLLLKKGNISLCEKQAFSFLKVRGTKPSNVEIS